ncbi:MAG TPA: hypothetical protein VGV57_13910 [Thermoleophilaceae bacterium]|nr:hypothetical protein [Thermoleophilaceae bacterium]
MVGPADPLEEGRDAARGADLADQLDGSDVDTEFERRGRHQGAQVAGAQPVLNPLAALARQRAVMGGHLLLAQPLAQLVGHPLGQLPGVDEDERGGAGRRALSGERRWNRTNQAEGCSALPVLKTGR